MSDQELYCICNGPYHDNEFMIQCDVCNDWFHGRCIGIEEYEASRIDTYHCPKCSDLFGPLTLKSRRVWHRQDYAEVNDGRKAIQNGNVSFVKQLDDRNFSCGEEIILNLTGADLSPNFLESEGFRRPILVKNKSDLDITVPPATFTVADVERYVGSMRNLDVIDVARQEDINMKMREWTEYYNSSDRKRVLNVISLEFSDTRLSDLIEAPAIVRHIDLLKHVWPKFSSETGPFRRPQVKKYCLMSVKASYTDFHIDFGGSSVWYHVLKGEKVFYLIEPTPENLITYEQWVSSKLQNEVFLGDEMQCYKCRIRQGETLFIPTGWIHAVYTPTDSLVFGGNFLHFLNMELQLKVYDLEIRLNTPEKFLFPFFETCIWYSGRYLVGLRGEKILVSPHLKEAAAAVLAYLRKWCLKENIKRHKRYIPTCINFKQLIIHLEEVVSEQLSTKIGSNSTEMKISDCVTKTCDTPGSEYSMQSKSYTCKKADLKGIGLKLSRNNQQSIVTGSSVPPLTLSLKATPRIKEKKASLENDFTGTCQELSHSIADAKDCAGRNSRNSSINNHKRQNDDSDAHERESKRRVSDFKSNPEYKDKNDESCNMLDDTPSAHFRDNDSNVKSPDLLLLGVATSAIENEKSKTKRVNSKTTKQRLGKILKIDKTGRYLW